MDKRFKRKITYSVLSVLNRAIPKKRRIVIYGGDRLNDNNEAIFKYLLDETYYTVICLATNHKRYDLRKNVKIVPCTNMNAIWYIMTSTVVLDSFLHAIRMIPTKRQLFIQMWHGTPLKRIDQNSEEKNGRYFTKILYPSAFYKDEFKKVFGANETQMLLGGAPRNDFLYRPYEGNYLRKFDGLKVIWMPTFRHGLGSAETVRDIPILDKNNIEELNKYLKNSNIYLFVKPHPHQQVSFSDLIKEEFRNIILINDSILDENNIMLYSFVGAMDALITDYSSIYFDYVLLNRPIAFAIDDIDEYQGNRGFAFRNPLEYMPGEKVYDYKGLVGFFDSLQTRQDNYEAERKRINNLANAYTDNKNCRRCQVLISKYLKREKKS